MHDKKLHAETFPQVYLAISTGQKVTAAFRIDIAGLAIAFHWAGFVFTELIALSFIDAFYFGQDFCPLRCPSKKMPNPLYWPFLPFYQAAPFIWLNIPRPFGWAFL
jgi:hypothetical protein